MSALLGQGDPRKGRSLLGGLGEGETGSVGAFGGVGAYAASGIEAFARVASSIAGGGTAASDTIGGRGSGTRGDGTVLD